MGLLVFLGDNPGLHSVQYHVIHGNSVPEVDASVHTQHSQDLELDRRQLIEQVVQLLVLLLLRDSFVDGDDQLVGLVDGELSLGVENWNEA